jgi:hypothetical protein
MKKAFYLTFLFAIALTGTVLAVDPPPIDGDPDPIPVDGGASLLLAAGVGYGLKRLKKSKTVVA